MAQLDELAQASTIELIKMRDQSKVRSLELQAQISRAITDGKYGGGRLADADFRSMKLEMHQQERLHQILKELIFLRTHDEATRFVSVARKLLSEDEIRRIETSM